MLASLKGHVEVVDRLIQHGAKVDLQSEVNYTTEEQNTRSISKCNNNRTCKVVDASCPYYYTYMGQ